MQTITKYILLTVCVLSAGCTPQLAPIDVDMVIIRDITDPMAAVPNVEDITAPLGLKANPWQSIRIHVTTISDKDINDVSLVTLEAENRWTGDLTLRKGTIEQFKKHLARCLQVKYNRSLAYSIIYPTVAQEANRLVTSIATKRYLLVYSDLCEHTPDFSFYDTHTIARLQKAPQEIAQQFEAIVQLKQLNGVELWLLYNPASYKQNNAYMPIANFYKYHFTKHGATAHIANRFLPL